MVHAVRHCEMLAHESVSVETWACAPATAPYGDCVGVPAVVRSNDADVLSKFIRLDTQYNVVTLVGATRCIVKCVGSCARPSAPGPPPTPAVVRFWANFKPSLHGFNLVINVI